MKLLILTSKLLVSSLLFWLSHVGFSHGSFGFGSVALVVGAFHWVYWRI